MSRSRSRLLRYRIDVLSVLVVVAALAAQLAALLLAMPWFTVLPILVLMRWQHLVAHNHCHLPIFWSRPLNEVLGWAMFLSGGVPLEAYRVFHADTHHRYTHRDGDWTSPFAYQGARFPDRPVGLLHYVLTYSLLSLWRRARRSSTTIRGASCSSSTYPGAWSTSWRRSRTGTSTTAARSPTRTPRRTSTSPSSAARSASTSAITPPIT